MLIQLVLTFVLLVAFLTTWKRARQRAIGFGEALMWSVVWVSADGVIWRPAFTTKIAHIFGVGRGVDFIVYTAVVVLLLLVFQLHLAHERLQRTLTKLVQRDALHEFEQEMKTKK